MKMRLFYQATTIGFIVCIAFLACGQSRKAVKSAEKPTLLKATVQRTLPGRQEGNIEKTYRFTVRWKSATLPESVYYKDDDKWMECEVSPNRKAQVNGTSSNSTLQLIASSSRVVAPLKPATENRNLIFKISKSSWQTVAVPTLEKEQDVVMP